MSPSSMMTSRQQPSAEPAARALKAALAGAALAALAATTSAAGPPLRLSPDIAELARGLICSPPQTGRREAPDTIAGWIHIPDEPLRIIHPSTTAPAMLGIGFGVEFSITGDQPLALRYTVTHPPLPPEGRISQSWDGTALPGMRESIFFQFDIEDELQPGRWGFTASHAGEEVFHAAFDVTTPEAAPHLTRLCREGALLSLARP